MRRRVREEPGGGSGKRAGYGTQACDGSGSVGMLGAERGPSAPTSHELPSAPTQLFTLPEQTKDHAPFPHDTLVVRSGRQLLSDVASLAVVDAVHKVDVGLEREGGEIGGTLRDGVDETVQVVVFGCDDFKQLGRGCAGVEGEVSL